MTLHMIQIMPDLARLMRWATDQRLLPDRGEADLGYVLHAVLTAAFADLAPKPFALLRNPRRPAMLLGYTGHSGAALRSQAAAFAMPELCDLLGIERLAEKTMPDLFTAGQRLGFELRVRPMVRTDRDGDRNSSLEKDAFLLSPPESSRGEVYATWLANHLQAGGAHPQKLVLDGFQLSRIQRRGADRSLRPIQGPDASFSGVLEVSDPAAFAAMLARGIGRHRAFGFGMLLLQPA
jgi:CRISPR system Cascade subunit CasE